MNKCLCYMRKADLGYNGQMELEKTEMDEVIKWVQKKVGKGGGDDGMDVYQWHVCIRKIE